MKTKGALFMRGKVLKTVVVLTVLSLGSAFSARAASPKIGYFDYQTIIESSKWGKKAMGELERKQKSLKGQVDQKAEEFKRMREELEKKRTMLDEKALGSKLQQLQRLRREGERTLVESSAELRKLESQLSAPITKKIVEIVQSIAKREKYDYIFEQRMSGIFYANPGEDLTSRIIKELDRVTPR